MQRYLFISMLVSINLAFTMEKSGLSQEVLDAQFRIDQKLLSASFEADQPELIIDLLERGAHIEARDFPLARTPLMINAFRGHPGAVQALLDAGAQVNAKSGTGGHFNAQKTALHEALEWCNNRNDNTRVVTVLLAAGADVEAADEKGKTPLLTALDCPRDDDVSVAILNLFFNAKPNLHARDKKGNTALHKAAKKSRVRAFPLLLANGLDVNTQNNAGNTALHKAKSAQAAAFLIKAGANTNARNEYGWTPLEKASIARIGMPDFIQESIGNVIRAIITTVTDQETRQLIQKIVDARMALAKQYLPKVPEAEIWEEIMANIKAMNESLEIKYK